MGGQYGCHKVWTCSTEVWGGHCAWIALGCIAIDSQRGPRSVESWVRVTSPGKWGTRVHRGVPKVHRGCTEGAQGYAKVHGCPRQWHSGWVVQVWVGLPVDQIDLDVDYKLWIGASLRAPIRSAD